MIGRTIFQKGVKQNEWCMISILLLAGCMFSACSSLQKTASQQLLNDTLLSKGFIGIHVYDIDRNKTISGQHSNRYFTPASTVKLFTTYASKRKLEKRIVGAHVNETSDTLFILPSGDPTFLHSDFSNHPLLETIRKSNKPVVLLEPQDCVVPYGRGWAWDDQSEPYMPARSIFPVFGNVLQLEWVRTEQDSLFPYKLAVQNTELPEFKINKKYNGSSDICSIKRQAGNNHFDVTLAGNKQTIKQSVPFDPIGLEASLITLRNISYRSVYRRRLNESDLKLLKPLYTQSTDSVIRQMLLRSDNFFAEQLLLQCSEKSLGKYDEQQLIDTLLERDLSDLPDKPRWVDGSGLSRYNLFTPRSQTYLLKKIIDSFGIEFIKAILAHNGEGTLKSFLSDLPPVIYAKTGTLSNNYCLTGILFTKSRKRLLFSVMINHSMAKPAYMRACVERYLKELMEQM